MSQNTNSPLKGPESTITRRVFLRVRKQNPNIFQTIGQLELQQDNQPVPVHVEETAEQRFNARRQALDTEIKDQTKMVSAYKGAFPAHLQTPGEAFNGAKLRMEKAENEGNYEDALSALGDLHTAGKTFASNRSQKTFESALKASEVKIGKIDDAITNQKFGNPVAPTFSAAVLQYNTARATFDDAVEAREYELAKNILNNSMNQAIGALDEATKDVRNRWEPLEKMAAKLNQEITQGTNKSMTKEAVTKYQKACCDQSKIATVTSVLDTEYGDYGAAWAALDSFEAAILVFRNEQKAATDKAASEFQALNKAGKSKKEIITTIQTLRKQHPDFLKSLTQTPEARKDFDKVINDLGKDAGSNKDFYKDVIKERFGLEKLEGDLDSECLPRLYKLFSQVPDSHSRQAKLKTVKRKKDVFKGTELLSSFYMAPDDDEEGGEVVLYGVRTSGPGSWAFDLVKENVFVRQGNLNLQPGEKPPTAFDWTTLHEIGHAVDENNRFMIRKGGDQAFGTWKVESPDSIAAEAAAQKNFLKDFDDRTVYPDTFLKKYLVNILNHEKGFVESAQAVAEQKVTPQSLGADPALQDYETEVKKVQDGYDQKLTALTGDENAKAKATKKLDKEKLKDTKKVADAALKKTTLTGKAKELVRKVLDLLVTGKKKADAVKSVLDTFDLGIPQDKTPDWKALEKHEAVAWCKTIRDSMGSGLIWKGEEKYRLPDKRVYQQGYPGQWYSYDSAAQAEGLTNYQFRAPGEWFAEAYAAFYVKPAPRLLPGGHPLYQTLDDDALAP